MSYKTSPICLKFSLLASFLLFLQISFAQDFNTLNELLARKEKQLASPVMAAVYKDGKQIFKKDQKEFDANTPLPLGAASRWLTVALVMTFVDEGKISLDDKVGDYLDVMSSYSKGHITIRQCLANLTGIQPDERKLVKLVQRNKFATLEEQAQFIASKYDIINNPGKDFSYGDAGTDIAGRVLEVVAKRKTFDQLMKERIFKPLNMKKSNFKVEEKAPLPATSGISTANDYGNFLLMLLNKGTFNGKKILSEESVQEMMKIQNAGVPVRSVPATMKDYPYALGTWVTDQANNGNPSVFVCPGFNGVFAYIDACRNYGAIVFVKKLAGEDKKENYLDIKETLDQQLASGCK